MSLYREACGPCSLAGPIRRVMDVGVSKAGTGQMGCWPTWFVLVVRWSSIGKLLNSCVGREGEEGGALRGD